MPLEWLKNEARVQHPRPHDVLRSSKAWGAPLREPHGAVETALLDPVILLVSYVSPTRSLLDPYEIPTRPLRDPY